MSQVQTSDIVVWGQFCCDFPSYTLGLNVTLSLDKGSSVIEPDSGESVSASVCFTAALNEPFDEDITFSLLFVSITSSATATFGVDFRPDFTSPFLTIPANFTGETSRCYGFEIIGDDEYERDEIVVYEVAQTNPPMPSLIRNFLNLTILENDGMIQ